jgi:tripartite-type tricarboxylate transporter receptor subunit TctC
MADRRSFLRLLASTAAIPALPPVAFGLDYPIRPVRVLVGFAPGGVPDLVARLVGQWLSDRLHQPFVVENHAGAASNLALEQVVRAAPDGYTLFEISVANAVDASIYQDVNIERDLTPIASIASAAFVIVVNPSFAAQTVPELIAYAHAHPGKLNFGSSATGTPPYLSVSLLRKMANIDVVQVPYRNSPQAIGELMGGRLDVAISDMSAIEYVKAGKLRALAVTTAARQKAIPDVPSLAEFVPGYDATTWYGLAAAKQTPAEIVDALSSATDAALADPAHIGRLAEVGLTVTRRSPAAFAAYIAEQTKKWGEVIRAADIKPL